MIAIAIAAAALLLSYLAVLALKALARGERTQLRTTHIRVLVPGLPDDLSGFTLAFLSDLHVGRLYVPQERLLRAIEDLDPDYLAFGGDYAAGPVRNREAAVALLQRLAARWPMVCILGNTDHYQYWDPEWFAGLLEEAGARLLVNDSLQVHVGAGIVEFVGLDEPMHGEMDVEKALRDTAEHPDLRIVVTHSPAVWAELGGLGAHIMLCGHTHGGQVRVPGMEALAVHPGIPRRLSAGLFRYERPPTARPRMERLASHWRILGRPAAPVTATTAAGPLMYVTRGVGTTGPRARLFCPPELVAIEFLADAAGAAEEAGESDT